MAIEANIYNMSFTAGAATLRETYAVAEAYLTATKYYPLVEPITGLDSSNDD